VPALLWGHAVLSGVVLGCRFLGPALRDKVVRGLCALGVAGGVALFVVRRSGDAWRATEIDANAAALAGIAVAVAWLIAAVLPEEDDRWRAAALVGPGAAGLALFASSRWVVPALLFWTITSIAAGALATTLRSPGEMWIGIVASDLCFAAGMIGHVLDNDTWQLPDPMPDRAFWFLLAAAVLRIGAIPRVGIWRSLGSPASAALPLLAGGGLVLAAGSAGRAEPWAAVGLLSLALAQSIWGSMRRDLAVSDMAGWPLAIALALMYTAPDVAPLAGAGALLAVGVLALWPLASGRGQPERGLLLTLAPPTAMFGALVYAATRAFEISTALDASFRSAPWIAVTGLIPLALASGVLFAARVGRERSVGTFDNWALGASWLLVLASVAIGSVPGSLELPDDVVGSQGSFLTLVAVALVVGVAAGFLWNLRHPEHRRTPAAEPGVSPVGPPTSLEARAYRGRELSLVERIVALVALALGVATLGAVAWITYEGLSQGFL
jgi:hypothetical protein